MAAMVPQLPQGFDLAAFGKEHLSYEAKMFAISRDSLSQGVAQGFDSYIRVEACVFHLRNLIDFFYPTKAKPDDVIAVHYAPNWGSKCPLISAALKAARTRAHKELAHLTNGRKVPASPDKKWDFGSLSAEMKPVIDAFIPLANPATLPVETVTALRAVGSVPTVPVIATTSAVLGSVSGSALNPG